MKTQGIIMASYVLVHGGDRDGTIWEQVSDILTKNGHQVFCPSMTSVKKATVKENIEEIVNYIKLNALDKFILVGHSYGGFVVSGVADQLSDQVLSLIFVDALIPKDGKSL